MAKKDFFVRGRSVAFVDWSNMYHQLKHSDWEICVRNLWDFLQEKTVEKIYIFAGKDDHPKSQKFLEEVVDVGYEVISKPVKYILGKWKCDFDVEITLAMMDSLIEGYDSFLLFSGDGDFAPVVERLLDRRKQVMIFSKNKPLGKELHELRGTSCFYAFNLSHLEHFIKKSPANAFTHRGIDLFHFKFCDFICQCSFILLVIVI